MSDGSVRFEHQEYERNAKNVNGTYRPYLPIDDEILSISFLRFTPAALTCSSVTNPSTNADRVRASYFALNRSRTTLGDSTGA